MSRTFGGVVSASWPGVVALLLATLALVGWQWHLNVLTRLGPWANPINPLVAVTLVLASLAWLGRAVPFWRRTLAAAVLAIGLSTLTALCGGYDLRLDRQLYADQLWMAGLPTHLAMSTAVALVLLGLALATLYTDPKHHRPTQLLSVALSFVALAQFVEHAYTLSCGRLIGPEMTMAPGTAIALMSLGVALLKTHPHSSLMALICGVGPGSSLLRWLLPVIFCLEFLEGELHLVGEQLRWFSATSGSTFEFSLSTALLSGLAYYCARKAAAVDLGRREAIQMLAAHALAAEGAGIRLESILEALPLAIMLKDSEGRFTFVNEKGLTYLGRTHDDVIGKTVIDLLGPTMAQVAASEKRIFETGETQTFENEWTLNDCAYIATVTRFPVRNAHGEIHETGVVLADITERFAREKELRRAHDRLEVLNQELGDFSSSISHELRTPVRAVEGLSEILLEDYGKLLDAKGCDYVARIRKNSQRMAYLLDDLIELSRITSVGLRRELIDLGELASEVADVLAQGDPTRVVDVVTAPDMAAWCNPHLVRRIFESLLNNAWRYTANQPNARITISAETTDTEMVVCVRDNGEGFEMADKDEIFLPFSRLAYANDHAGAGLGLSSLKRAITRDGGRVWAEGNPGRGAAFFFTLSVRSQAIEAHRTKQEVT